MAVTNTELGPVSFREGGMGKKVRKQVTLTEEQAATVARRAQELGVSEQEVVRQALALA